MYQILQCALQMYWTPKLIKAAEDAMMFKMEQIRSALPSAGSARVRLIESLRLALETKSRNSSRASAVRYSPPTPTGNNGCKQRPQSRKRIRGAGRRCSQGYVALPFGDYFANVLIVLADFDPEADIPESDSDASGDDEQEDKDAGAREHYAPVGKSKLRKPKEVALGPQYSGSRVTRDAIEDEEDDDPFARGFDDEDSEEDEEDVNS